MVAVLLESSVGLAAAEIMISSANARGQSFQNLVQQSAKTHTLDLATTAASVKEILGRRSDDYSNYEPRYDRSTRDSDPLQVY